MLGHCAFIAFNSFATSSHSYFADEHAQGQNYLQACLLKSFDLMMTVSRHLRVIVLQWKDLG